MKTLTWQKPGQQNVAQELIKIIINYVAELRNNYNYQCSSWSVENGAYVRLKNLTIGYTLPATWLAKTKVISKLRVYVTGADLWEHSNIRDGWDPEQTRKVENLGRYPFNRTYTVGINATF